MLHAVAHVSIRCDFRPPLPGEGQRMDFTRAMRNEFERKVPVHIRRRWWHGFEVTVDLSGRIDDDCCCKILQGELEQIPGQPLVLTPNSKGCSEPLSVAYELIDDRREDRHGFPLSLNHPGFPRWVITAGGLAIPADIELNWPTRTPPEPGGR